MELGLRDKVAVVTGGGSGIGAAICRQLAHEGVRVVIADIDMEAANRVAEEINEGGGRAMPAHVDVGNAQSVERLFADTVAEWGGLNLAVNNAGIHGIRNPTGSYPIEEWQRVTNVNLNGVFYCMKHEINAMLECGGGSIVNVSSILGTVALPLTAAYTAAKHGVVGLTKAAAIEYARFGIRINVIGPGWIDTPLVAEVQQAASYLKRMDSLQPMGRRGKPEEVAGLACFLLSSQASFITGSYHAVDGAYTSH
ncbi:SDR family oxidoreductase [Rhizobium grahamii]|uniref:SDR family oxidoreductase n=1 Tax=Rhizobium grahamii TaxID=1120045 RepID=A0A5Q0C7N5_9HYPH|nr:MULTISPECIES: SDR family oxidoreductase [Rhizobium]QFY59977.1 SDR family oxidoreductase [Rhizobium grahamii]QRM50904.1 SDR family oxidoreductase [Rhizobium sp. BG6]